MRRDRTAAQILFILYVVGIAVAAPAGVRERHRDVAEAVRARSERRDDSVATAASAAEPDNRFLDRTLREKIWRYSILGSIVGITGGLISGVQKDIFGTVSPGAYVSTLFPSTPADI
jgi:hypothetical protein